MSLRIPDYILGITPYEPGKPIEELQREYGITDPVKLASNENPLGPSPKAVAAVAGAVAGLHRYPDGGAVLLRQALARHLDVAMENIVTGNGSDDLIALIATAFMQPGDEVIIPHPSFLMYDLSVIASGARPIFVPLTPELGPDLTAMAAAITEKTRVIYVCTPNNPTGTAVKAEDFRIFMDQVPDHVLVIVDEAYAEFVRDPEALRGRDWALGSKPVISLRTFSKAYGLAGLRVGYALTTPEIAAVFHRVRSPFNVNLPGQIGAAAALEDRAFLEETVRLTHEGLDYLYARLTELGLSYVPTQSNFFLIDVKRPCRKVFEALLHRGVIVRPMDAYGYPTHIRINTGTMRENERFVTAMKDVLTEEIS